MTPHYIEIEHDGDCGYNMGVYLCVGQSIHCCKLSEALRVNNEWGTFQHVHEYIAANGRILLFLGSAQHKIKRKAEQIACNTILTQLN